MAVLSREEYLNALRGRMGESPSDDDVKFLEDMTDTYDAVNSGDDWKKKYEENDAAWRQRYTDRFFNREETTTLDATETATEETQEETAEEVVDFDDLFTE